jgi:hypothetical protein
MILINSSHRGRPKVSHGHEEESQTHSDQTHESSSDSSTNNTQAPSYRPSTHQKTSNISSTSKNNYTRDALKSVPIPEHHTHDYPLRGISSQFADVRPSTKVNFNQYTWSCPYHGPILDFQTPNYPAVSRETDMMARYVSGNPSEQYALFYRPDVGRMSIGKGCVCAQYRLGGEPLRTML